MIVISETEERTTRTPAATMAGLAAPSRGGSEVSTWRVRIADRASTPVHVITKEQVWMPVSGAFEVTAGDTTERFHVGQAAVIAAGEVRKVTAVGGDAEALVAMAVGGKARMPGSDADIALPWAE